MIQINQVFKVKNRKLRVLWSNPEIVFWIDIENNKAWPESIEYSIVEELILDNEIRIEKDPYQSLTLLIVEKKSKRAQIRDKAMNAIKEALLDVMIFYPKERGKAVQKIKNDFKICHQSINRFLRRYWQRGMCENALLPDYVNCGNRGKAKDPKSKKLGRARKIKRGKGKNITEFLKKLFRRVINKKILKNKQSSPISHAYYSLLNLVKSIDPKIKETNLPTYDQFYYFYKKEYSLLRVIKEKFTSIDYKKDVKPLNSTSTTEAIGPGYRFQIDATMADIYLVSDNDRTLIVGRPTLYFVIDVFSRTIAGFYVGFENPSWGAAMNALANTVEDKVEFCKKYDIDILPEEWPVNGVPNTILADKGEFLGANVETIASAYGIRIENAPARRGDAKGIVEREFRTTQVKFKAYAPAIVDPIISKKRGKGDYREDAKLTINDFTKIIINLILHHNNYHVIRGYDQCKDMPTDIPNVPLHIWNWGIANLTGSLRAVDNKTFKINMMATKEVTTSDLGIKLFGCYYNCTEARAKGWFHRKINNRPKKVIVSYDMRNTNIIYLRPSQNLNDYWECNLSDRSRRFKDLTFTETLIKTNQIKKTEEEAKLKSGIANGKVIEENEKIVNAAIKAQPNKIKVNASNGGQTIRENRLNERDVERQKFSEEQISINKSYSNDNVDSTIANEYAYPSMADLLSGGDTHE